jgi:hypothetical protein
MRWDLAAISHLVEYKYHVGLDVSSPVRSSATRASTEQSEATITGPRGMSVPGPSRHLVRRSDLVAIGVKRTLRGPCSSVAADLSNAGSKKNRCTKQMTAWSSSLIIKAVTQFAERDHYMLAVCRAFLEAPVPCLDVRHGRPLDL